MQPSQPPAVSSEQEIFEIAAELPSTQRAEYLQLACAGRPEVRVGVEQLLNSLEDDAFMERAADRTIVPELEAQLARAKSEASGDEIGNYKLREQIGEGAFGTVWVADQARPVRRRVALKIIKLGMDTKEVIARFEQERQALAVMDHPNIAKVFDAGATESGRPYFAMELVRGVKITRYCDGENLSTAERLRLFIAVCHAVQHAHQKGIIHRDLKPSNILVTLHDGVPVPKVIDFGVAKATQQQRLTDITIYTQFEQMIGTPLYMSPEQAEMSGLDIDTRSDIYSLGVLLYELLTGHTPFNPESLMKAGFDEMRRVIREQEPQKPSTFASTLAADLRMSLARQRRTDSAKLIGQIRGDLDWIVMKALEKDRSRRYDTANAFAEDIARHLQSEPVQARPPTMGYRLRRLARRNKAAFAAAGAVLAALLGGLGASTWMFFKEKHARERAVAAENAQREERKSAERAARKSEQVAQFLKTMLEGVGPSVALGRDTKLVREILDKTAERVGKDLKDQRDVEAQLRSIIGDVYLDLGEFAEAHVMHGEALAIRKKLFGNENPDVAQSLSSLARVLRDRGKLAEAEAMHREALAMFRKLLGNEHPSVAIELRNLGSVLNGQGRRAEAETIHREALAIFRTLFGNEHPFVAESLFSVGFSLWLQAVRNEGVLPREQALSQVETMYREALEIYRKAGEDENHAMLGVTSQLGLLLNSQGKRAEAEAMLRQNLETWKKLVGNEDPRVGSQLLTLMETLWGRQDTLPEAESMCREALAIFRKAFGDEHPRVAVAALRLAEVLEKQRKLPEAEAAYREALALSKEAEGDAYPRVVKGLISVLIKQANLAGAETLAREVLAIRRKLLGDEHQDVFAAVNTLCNLLREQGKWAEEETLRRETVATIRKAATSDPVKLEGTLVELAEAIYRQNRYAEAEPLYHEVIDSRRARGAKEGVTGGLAGPMANLARLLSEWAWSEYDPNAKINDSKSKPAARAHEAVRLLRDCLVLRLGGPEPSHWRTANARSCLGGALFVVAATDPALTGEDRHLKFTEAEALLLEGNDVMEGAKSVETRYIRDSFARLIRLYQTWGKVDKTAFWQQKLNEFDKLKTKSARGEK